MPMQLSNDLRHSFNLYSTFSLLKRVAERDVLALHRGHSRRCRFVCYV